MHLGGAPSWCISPQSQPWPSGNEPASSKALSRWRSAQVCSPCSDPDLPPLDRHLAQNPFICDCNLKWLADFLRTNPIETSGARCASPRRLANKRIGQIKSKKFRCSGSRWPPVCLQPDQGCCVVPRMAPARVPKATLDPCWRVLAPNSRFGYKWCLVPPLGLLRPGEGELAEGLKEGSR